MSDFDWAAFVMSPGFGGTAAVVAAVIAYLGVTRSVRVQRESNRKDQWWERARWALDLTLSDDATTREVGFEVLDALSDSDYAKEHESDDIKSALEPTLRSFRSEASDGTLAPDDSAEEAER